MPTQISLSCPISQLGMKTPLKGHICGHHQCSDYNYFININAIRPTWKCCIRNKRVLIYVSIKSFSRLATHIMLEANLYVVGEKKVVARLAWAGWVAGQNILKRITCSRGMDNKE